MGSEATWGRLVTLDEALAEDASLLRLTAPVGAGKTEFIVRKAAQLVANGTDAAQICCVVSSPAAQFQLRERLTRANAALRDCTVLTPLQLFTEILATPKAQAFTQRGARILCTAEFNMLLEDLKLAAPDAAILRPWLQKLFRRLATLDDADAWGLDAAEADLYHTMLKHLKFQGATLREEAPALAAKYLQASPDARRTYSAVLVDDAQNLSAATMEVCRLLSADMMLACGNPNQAQAGSGHSANLQAYRAFGEAATCLQLEGAVQPAAIPTFCDALCQKGGMDVGVVTGVPANELPDEDALTCIKWKEPADEFRGVAQTVRLLTSGPDAMNPGDVLVLVPNGFWAQEIARHLRKAGLESSLLLGAQPVAGNPHVEGSGTLDAYCRLALAANINDISAWRLWCGLGSRDCGSRAWDAFETWAKGRGLAASDALAALGVLAAGDEQFRGASKLRARYLTGLDAARELARLRGFALTKAIRSHAGGQQIVDLLAPFRGDEDASELYDRLAGIILEPNPVLDWNRVTIGSYELVSGLDPRCVIACGLIEGYMPRISHAELVEGSPATRARQDAQRRVFYSAVGKARERLLLSTVQRAEAALADELRLDARRSRLEHGRQVVVLSPSCFIDEAGDAAPSSVSGEQFLAELRDSRALG